MQKAMTISDLWLDALHGRHIGQKEVHVDASVVPVKRHKVTELLNKKVAELRVPADVGWIDESTIVVRWL